MGKTATKKPALALSPKLKDTSTVEKWMQRVSEILNIGQGIRGDKLDRNLTLRDIQNFDDLPLSVRTGLSTGVGSDLDIGDPIGYTLPPLVTGFAAEGGYSFIHLHWDIITYFYLAHVEIWRSATNNFGEAEKIGTTSSQLYTDDVGSGSGPLYYWIIIVSERADVGSVNQTAGTVAETSLDPAYVISVLSDSISRTELASSLSTEIDVIQTDLGDAQSDITTIAVAAADNVVAIQTEATARATETGELYAQYTVKLDVNGYVSGYGLASEEIDGNTVSSFVINADNFAIGKFGQTDAIPFAIGTVNGVTSIGMNAATFIMDLTVTDAKVQSLKADKLFVDSGTIAAAIIGTADINNAMIGDFIESTTYIPGLAGWHINKNAFAEFQNIVARGNIEATLLKANTVMVETDHMIFQAITIPVSTLDETTRTTNYAEATGSHTGTEYSSWTVIDDITFSSTGAPLNLYASADIGFENVDVDNAAVNHNVFIELIVRENGGGDLSSPVVVVSLSFIGQVVVYEHPKYIRRNMFNMFVVPPPGSGWKTYELAMRLRYDAPSGGAVSEYDFDLKVYTTQMSLLETKR